MSHWPAHFSESNCVFGNRLKGPNFEGGSDINLLSQSTGDPNRPISKEHFHLFDK